MSEEKILFVYPALAAVTPFPRLTPERKVIFGHNVLVFRGYHLFYKDGAAHYEREKEPYADKSAYLLEVVPGVWSFATSQSSDEAVEKLFAQLPEGNDERWKTEGQAILADPAAYTERKKVEIAARRAKREEEERILKAKREADRLEHEKELIRLSSQTFRDGHRISFEAFEKLCSIHGIELHIRTIGAGRKNINEIGHNSMNVSNGSKPDKVFKAAAKLYESLKLLEQVNEVNDKINATS